MEGYDTALITAFFAFPVFRRSYGTKTPGTATTRSVRPGNQESLVPRSVAKSLAWRAIVS